MAIEKEIKLKTIEIVTIGDIKITRILLIVSNPECYLSKAVGFSTMKGLIIVEKRWLGVDPVFAISLTNYQVLWTQDSLWKYNGMKGKSTASNR